MQQSSQMLNGGTPSVPLTNITTEQIQMYLEENKQLILAIMESQNQGQLTECEPGLVRMVANEGLRDSSYTSLEGLRRIWERGKEEDSYKARLQQNLTYLAKLADAQQLPATPPQSKVQQGHPMQHPPQAAMSVPSTKRFSVQLNDDQKPQQQQLMMQAQMCNKPGATSPLHQFGGGNKQDGIGTGATAADFLGKAASGYNHGDTEPPYG
ncbi:hypothetical protein FNV43_RR23856 [Rhamnella rubrinervis]|uniref:SS18 N-terminal domain-containing protein n=1 Tax=Rhamnella rubrinervis TaxID=2594499 RepID=A0A8K0DRD8_9ROSA|nr:hypothetical protein FNV43_RR23856 [Rhamnella rubrinervis]